MLDYRLDLSNSICHLYLYLKLNLVNWLYRTNSSAIDMPGIAESSFHCMANRNKKY
jgi:hypothetical protein